MPIDVQHAEARFFGVGPPLFVLGAAVVVALAGAVLLAGGRLLLGLLALAAALCLLPAYLAGARRWPDTPLARTSLAGAARARDEARAAVQSVAAWSTATRELARLRRERFRLRRERAARIRELGVSVYSDDGRADELKAAARELDELLAANERERMRVIGGARRQVRKERAAVASTEVIEPERPAGAE